MSITNIMKYLFVHRVKLLPIPCSNLANPELCQTAASEALSLSRSGFVMNTERGL